MFECSCIEKALQLNIHNYLAYYVLLIIPVIVNCEYRYYCSDYFCSYHYLPFVSKSSDLKLSGFQARRELQGYFKLASSAVRTMYYVHPPKHVSNMR